MQCPRQERTLLGLGPGSGPLTQLECITNPQLNISQQQPKTTGKDAALQGRLKGRPPIIWHPLGLGPWIQGPWLT